jgi:F0F1-type ATP synthase membrane subunit b/b'
MATNSTQFGVIWASMGIAFFMIIVIVNSFAKPPININ